jgi:Tol biopolymer transport system component
VDAETLSPLRVGTDFGPFSIVGLVGRGGMGIVYRARQRYPDRVVALKVLSPEVASNPDFRERFVREWNSAAIDHPNIVPVFQAGEIADQLYIAMRHVEGADLGTLIGLSKALDPSRTIWILRQVSMALDAAHARGLVHGDVKPGNILVASGRGSEPVDHAYLSDFGLTWDLDGREAAGRLFVGTVEYLPPERIESKVVDSRADLYSLCCVLYECLAGAPPFRRGNVVAVMHAHLAEAPPKLSQVRPDLPADIDAVIARGLAKRPEDRYRSCTELILDAAAALRVPAEVSPGPILVLPPALDRPDQEEAVMTPSTPLVAVRPHRWRWAVAVIGLVALGAVAVLRLRSGPSSESQVEQSLIGAPDFLFAFASSRGGNTDIYQMHTNGTGLSLLTTSPAQDEGPAWSPDGSKLTFTSNRYGSADIFQLDVSTGGVSRLTTSQGVNESATDWSPDGSKIVFQADLGGNREIFLMNADGTGMTNLTNHPADDTIPDWSPDGRIAFTTNRDGNWEIYVMGGDGSDPTNLTHTSTDEAGPAWSPSGAEIAFQSWRGGNPEIWVMRGDGQEWRRVTRNRARDNAPVWTPDGAYLAFISDRHGNKELYLMKATGSTVWRLTEDPADDQTLAFFPQPTSPSAGPS